MKKIFISIALSLILLMSMVPTAVFADYKGASSWAVPELDKAANMGMVLGVGGAQFADDSVISGPVFSNEALKENMEKLDSYRRITRTVTTSPESKDKWESIKEFAYIRNPVSRYFKLYFPDSGGSYQEETIIGSKMWDRSGKDEVWTEWNEWYYDPPVSFKYDIDTQPYPIDYGKLKYAEAGTERINGVNCIKYTVSGTYSDELTFEGSPEKFPITLSASGTIWIADDPAIKTAIIRQRITVNTDITISKEKAEHSVSEDVIEDDVMDINSVKISPPSNAKKGN